MKLSTHGILAALGAIVLTLLIQSNTAFGTTTAGAPTGLVLALDGNGNDLTVTFSPAASAPHFYEIELHRSASSTGRYSPVAKQGVTASPASFEYQPRKYWYKARGRNCTTAARTTCGAWGSLGTAVEIPTHKSPPPAPSGLTPTSSTATVVNLRWSSLSGAAKYRVEYSDSPDGPWAEAFYELGLTAYRLEALECDTGYYFRISARGDGTTYLDTYGEPSEPAVAARTTSCVTQANRLEAPTGLTVTPDGTVMRLAWTAVTGAVHYKAERSTSTDGPWSTVRFPATAAKRNDHLGLECNTLYYYRVRARGNGSTKSRVFSDPSAVVSNTTASCASITPSVKLVGLAETVSKGSNDSFTVSASNLSATGSYTISVATNSADLAFNSACTLRTKSISRTSQSTPMRVYGCDSTGGEITATLNDGTTAVHKEVAGVAVTRPSMLTVAPTDPLLGQATTLTAIPDSSEGTVLSYVFERIPLDDTVWRDVSALATNPKKAKYADYNTRGNGFRVVIAYSSGKTVTSEVLTASWRPLKVSIEVSEPNLESNLSSNRSATLEAVTPDETFPAGTKFQWYRDEGEGWEQFGTATSSKTKVVSFRTAGTRSYRVRTQHTQMPDGHTISRGASSPVHLTWDEPETLSALLTALDTAVTGNSDYGRDETTLVACMNRVSGPSGSSGNATSTPPLLGGSSGASSNYSNFNGILDDYTGDTKDYMEMSQHCKSNADTMFATFEDVVEDELETLLDDNANYSRMLAAPRWNNFEALISDTDLLKLSAGMKSYAPAGDGAGGTSDENTTTTPRSGVGCLPYSGRDPVDKQERLAVLNPTFPISTHSVAS